MDEERLNEVVARGHYVIIHPWWDGPTGAHVGWHVGIKEHRTEPTTTYSAKTLDAAVSMAYGRFGKATVPPKRKLTLKR